MDSKEKTRENLLRRMAARQGLSIHKSRSRDPRALDYRKWMIVNLVTNTAETAGFTATLDDVERRLTEDSL